MVTLYELRQLDGVLGLATFYGSGMSTFALDRRLFPPYAGGFVEFLEATQQVKVARAGGATRYFDLPKGITPLEVLPWLKSIIRLEATNVE